MFQRPQSPPGAWLQYRPEIPPPPCYQIVNSASLKLHLHAIYIYIFSAILGISYHVHVQEFVF